MRKFFYTFLLFGVLANSYGQISLGGYVGTNNATFTSIPRDSTRLTQNLGLVLGLQFSIPLKEDILLSIDPAFAVERSGVEVVDTLALTTLNTRNPTIEAIWLDTADFSFQQIQIPVLAKVLSKNRQWTYIGGLGLSIPLNLRLYNDTGDYRFNDLTKISLEGIMGFGYQLNLKRNSLNLGVRFHQSLTRTTVFNEDLKRLSGLKTRSLRIILSWRIRLKKDS